MRQEALATVHELARKDPRVLFVGSDLGAGTLEAMRQELPKQFSSGMNFGITLSIWDYLFKTAYIPSDGRDIKLGFPNSESFPKTFIGQFFKSFRKNT